jgi:hypothetical protein
MFDRDSEMIWESYRVKAVTTKLNENAAATGMNMPPGLAKTIVSFDLEPEVAKPTPNVAKPKYNTDESEPIEDDTDEFVDADEIEEEDEERMISFKEAFNEVGSVARKVSPERMSSWMADAHAKKEYLNKSKASPEEVRKYNALKANRPIIHKGNAAVFEIVNNNGDTIKTYDVEGYKKLIMERPKSLLKANSKMEKSGGDTLVFYNTTLPAIQGLAVNETTGDLIVVNTCPGADECKNDCYARKGNYVKNKAASINQQRTLNYILNDYEGYKEELRMSLHLNAMKNKRSGKKTVLRFNDSGDMLSDKYFEMAADLARSMPDVLFYGYTKSVAVAKSVKLPENFVMNYSMGGTQDNFINSSDKQSIIVFPKKIVEKTGFDLDKLIKKLWSIDDEVNMKKGISKKFNVPLNKIFTVKEVQNSGNLELPEGAVIVKLPDEHISNHPETQIIDVKQKDPTKPAKKLVETMANVISSKNIYANGQQGVRKFKEVMAKSFNIDIEKLLTMDELYETPVGEHNEYNVIVLPGESDLSASRRDVHITFLYLH